MRIILKNNTYINFKDGNEFTEYHDFLFTKPPLVIVDANAEGVDGSLCINPTLLDLCSMMHRIFLRILDVNKNIPRVEMLLFPGNIL